MSNYHPILPPQQSQILRLIRREGTLSRWELHERTSLRPNAVGAHVAELLEQHLLCEGAVESSGPGRPRIPLSIDRAAMHVVGAALRPGHVEACRLNLCGQAQGRLLKRRVSEPRQMVGATRRLLRDVINGQTVLVGLTTTGFVDPGNRRILLSSALPGERLASLDELLDVVGQTPLAVENDMHALAARWLQEHHYGLDQDVLLVYLDDGQLGSALLVRGEPNWGCLVGGNELGHTRLPVETATCYCGHTGCMERICSTEFVRNRGAVSSSLLESVNAFDGTEPAMVEMIELLATGLANAINFVRPHRVVLVSQFTRSGRFIESLMLAVRSRVMTALTERVQFHYWDEAATRPGEAAGWLALAALYYPNWTKAILNHTRGDQDPVPAS